jgi:GH15 family glucan-1,4-alpha-glucosidase
VSRIEGYAPIADYGVIGDGRTAALVARDGAIDWLCFPDLDSASVFGALVDSERGGRFILEPETGYETSRRYAPRTNVLETTFTTSTGVARVTDALTLPSHGLSPYRELVRRIDGITGHVPFRWRVEPRFSYGSSPARFERRAGVPDAASGRDAIAVCAFGAGEPLLRDGSTRR